MAAPGKSLLLTSLAPLGTAVPEVVKLFDQMKDLPLWMKDAAGHYLWVNAAFLHYFGLHDRRDIIGLSDFDLCSEVLANQYRIDDERVLAGERIVSRVEMIGRFDHSARWCVTSKIPLVAQGGRVVGTAGVTRPLERKGEGTPPDSPLTAAIVHISLHFGEPLPNQHLAAACGLSIRAFERQFRQAYGSTPHDYVRQMRVRMACRALVHSRTTLADVATRFGFSDQSHFTKEFHRVMGEGPWAYRKRHQG
jgi:AraC-like DNA-binding protein